MKSGISSILIYGYGNPGRQDDGLGNEFCEKMQEWAEKNNYSFLDFDSNYQLNIEDADRISEKEIVVFADASVEDIDSFQLTKVIPDHAKIEFTMHAVSPSFVMKLCQDIYKKTPHIYLLHLKGYKWDFREGLTARARKNLNAALKVMQGILAEEETGIILQKLESLTETVCCNNH